MKNGSRRMPLPKCLFIIPILAIPACAQFYSIQKFAGGGAPFDESALTADFGLPSHPVVDTQGNLYVSLSNELIVVRVTAGQVVRIAGNGTQGFSGDNGPALNAQLYPTGLALDADGNLYVLDANNNRIRKVDAATGVITTVAGNGNTWPPLVPGAQATAFSVSAMSDIAVDPGGNLHIFSTCQVLKVDESTGLVSRVAGNGQCGFSGDGGPATSAQIQDGFQGIAFDASGNLYISDESRIRKIDAITGIITTVAGGGPMNSLGDGGPATSAWFDDPTSVALDASGNIYVADSMQCRIRKVDAASGIITTIAGTGVCGFTGDGGPAASAQLGNQLGVTADSSGNVFIADSINGRIRRIDASAGTINTYAGDGLSYFSGDGEPVAYSQTQPLDLAIDPAGNLYIADASNRVRKVDAATGIINTVAGNGVAGFSGDGGPATTAAVVPVAIAVDASGNLFIADGLNTRVRKVDTAGTISTFAGGGTAILSQGQATTLRLASVSGVAADSSGNVYVLDNTAGLVYKVDPTGMMKVVAGVRGRPGGTPATTIQLGNPKKIAADSSGNLYIAEMSGNQVIKVDPNTGSVTTVAGVAGVSPMNGTDHPGDGGPATSALLVEPNSLAIDSGGNLFIGGYLSSFIRRVDASTGIISTVAGDCTPGDAGSPSDGALATTACVAPQALAAGPGGTVYIAEPTRIDLLTPIPPDEPVIGFVVNAASMSTMISPGAWISIMGANLSSSTRSWNSSDFSGDSLPLTLDGVSVTVNGSLAAISYISPSQINALCPDIAVSGSATPVSVQVSVQGNLSSSFATQVLPLAPALFSDGQAVTPLVLAVHLDGSLVGKPGDFGSASTRPAVVGETISIFGTGFGPSVPPISAGIVPAQPEPLAGAVSIWIGNLTTPAAYAGIVEAGLVQINFAIPTIGSPGFTSGLLPLEAVINGVHTGYLYLLVQQN
jgi:uncharacterized protein (TIGR03437 family)